jgi:hypothetical protein
MSDPSRPDRTHITIKLRCRLTDPVTAPTPRVKPDDYYFQIETEIGRGRTAGTIDLGYAYYLEWHYRPPARQEGD